MTELPPLVVGASVSTWMRVRDVVLTLLAWALLLWLMRYGVVLLVDYLRPPRFEFSIMEPPNWSELGRRLRPFLEIIAVLLLWLLCWALLRGRAMRIAGVASQPQPPALSLHEYAADFGLAASEVDVWRGARVMVVRLGDDNHSFRADIREPM